MTFSRVAVSEIVFIKIETVYLRNIDFFVDFIRLSEKAKVNTCSHIFFKAYPDDGKTKNDDKIKQNCKICEKIFIHNSNTRIFVNVENFKHNYFCYCQYEIHVCSVPSKLNY